MPQTSQAMTTMSTSSIMAMSSEHQCVTQDPFAAAMEAAAEIARRGEFLYNTAVTGTRNPGMASLFASKLNSGNPASFLPSNHTTTAVVTPPKDITRVSVDSAPFSSDQVPETNVHRTMAIPPLSPEMNSDEEDAEDSEKRIARSRERNREHARRTRLRKKAQLEALQSKVKGLQAESKVLKQSLEECSIATILLGLSMSKGAKNPKELMSTSIDPLLSPDCNNENKSCNSDFISQLVSSGKRKRFLNDTGEHGTTAQPLSLNIDGKLVYFGGGTTHVNWKTGAYTDDQGVHRRLTEEQLETLRRERNRMHAKMTRDRKKNFIATIEKTISELEGQNLRMKQVLAEVVQTHFKPQPSPVTPEISARTSPVGSVSPILMVDPSVCTTGEDPRKAKRMRLGTAVVG